MGDDSNVAISVKNVKKDFHMARHKEDSIKRKITQAFKKKDRGVDVHHALRGVSFEIKKGEFFGILGRNGSGKSTLLKIMAEIYQPTGGSVKVRGKLVPFIELGVGFNAELTGRENVFLNGALLGFSKKEMRDRYDKIVEFAELEEYMDQKLKNYSSGMKVRLAFSVAIQADADILLLDEVLAVGDAAFQRKCYDYFKSLKSNKKTIVFVSHNMSAVREYCDKAILIEEGKISHEGSADEVADEYMKLFNESSRQDIKGLGKRWGTQTVRMESVTVHVTREQFELSVDIVSDTDKPKGDIKFGFRVKNNQGDVVAGANNLNIEGGTEVGVSSSNRLSLKFTSPNILGNQSYTVSASVISRDGLRVYDSWEDIVSFDNDRPGVYYPILIPATLTVNDDHIEGGDKG